MINSEMTITIESVKAANTVAAVDPTKTAIRACTIAKFIDERGLIKISQMA